MDRPVHSDFDVSDPKRHRWVAIGLWLLPLHGLLTLVATFAQQPDPSGDFAAWSRFVTTSAFYWSHLIGSTLGQALGVLGVVALAVRLAGGRRGSAALAALVMTVMGSSVVFGLFGVAAFVQPAIGAAYLDGRLAASDWYDAVFGVTLLVPALVGLIMYSSATVVMALALRTVERLPRWVAIAYGASGPCIGVLGVAVHALQTAGSLLLILSGIVVARRLATTPPEPAPADPAAPIGGVHT